MPLRTSICIVTLALGSQVLGAGDSRADRGDRLHVELDPLPFARGGYGGQIGVRPQALAGLRLAVASFSLDVPDFATQLGDGHDGFHLRVRPSAAVYALYYPSRAGRGLALGAALRYLRLQYSHDDTGAAVAKTREISPELIAAYKWKPTTSGFYLQPWLGLSTTLWRSDEPVVDTLEYSPLPVQAFFTVNLGYERAF